MATGSFIGVGNFKGYWDATDNSGSADFLNTGMPLLATSASSLSGYSASVDPAQVASVGDYWQVNVAGSTEVDAESNWALNDWVVYQGDETTSPTTYTWNRLSVTDTIAATVIGDASQSGLKNTLLASASANSGPKSDSSTYVGQFGEVLFCSASNADGTGTNKYLEGDSNFTWDPDASVLNVTGTLQVLGEIQATQLHTNYVTSSILYDSGDTKFGDSADDQHQFTGSITCTIGITSSTNVQAAYFEGDGSRLTGIEGSALGNPVYVSAAQYRVPHWGAADGDGDFGLTGSANLSFYTATNELQVTGNVRATKIYVANSILHEGDTDTSIDFSTNQIDLNLGGYPFASFSNTEAVINPDSETYSFQIMGTTHQDTFYVNGPSNNIGIRCIPTGAIEALMVSGSTRFGSASANSHEFTGSMFFGNSVYTGQDIIHWDDPDTYIRFTNDQIDFVAGSTTLLTLDEDGQDVVTIGEGSTDIDFQVKSPSDTKALCVWGEHGRVGVGYNEPAQKLSVSGSTVFGRESGEDDSHWFSGSVFVSNDLHVEDKIYGLNDPNTYIDFNTDDQLEIAAGGVSMVKLIEGGATNYLRLGNDSSYNVDIRIGAGGNDDTLWVDGGSHNVGIRCAPSGTIQALTVSGSTVFGSGSISTHEFTGSVFTDSSIYFADRLVNWADDDTYIQFGDDSMTFRVGNLQFLDLEESVASQDITTFNAGGQDIDVVIKSNGGGLGGTSAQTHTIFVEGSSAKVGIAESSPGAQLDVSGSTIFGRHDGDTVSYHQVSGTLELTGNIGINTPATAYSLVLPNTDSVVGRGMAYAWSTYSSSRFKENVFTMSDPIETAKKLRGVEFTWKNSGNKDFGFIAEEVGKILPQIVAYEEDGYTATGMDYSKITSLLVECVKSQQSQIETQEKRIKQLEKKFKT